MAKKGYISNAELIHKSRLLIDNSLNDEEIKKLVLKFNYDEKRLTEGKNLLTDVENLCSNHNIESGLKIKSTKDFNDLFEECKSVVHDTIIVAKISLSDNIEVKNIIESFKKKNRAYHEWVDRAKKLYDHLMANTASMEKLSKNGYSKEKLTSESELIKELIDKKNLQIQKSGNIQSLTVEKNSKLKELKKWNKDYTAIVKIALKDMPQKLEKLGIKV